MHFFLNLMTDKNTRLYTTGCLWKSNTQIQITVTQKVMKLNNEKLLNLFRRFFYKSPQEIRQIDCTSKNIEEENFKNQDPFHGFFFISPQKVRQIHAVVTVCSIFLWRVLKLFWQNLLLFLYLEVYDIRCTFKLSWTSC